MTIKHEPGNHRLEETIRELERKVVKVGYFPGAVYPDGTPVAGVAAVQELGSITRRIPPRPTFRPAVVAGKAMQKEAIAAAVRRAVKGTQSLEDGLEHLGSAVVGDIKEAIIKLTAPPLKQSTLDKRKRDGITATKPLVRSGLMLQLVTHVVENK